MLGLIYIITDKINININYIGSTIQTLNQRWACHKNRYTKNISNSLYPYMIKYGIDNFEIKLLKQYEIEDLKHLKAYEQLWLNKIKNINFQKAFNPFNQIIRVKLSKEKTNYNYYEKNKEKVKEYYENNKDKIKESKKEYYEKNKQLTKEKNDKIYHCDKCNCNIRYGEKSRHNKSKKHLE